MGVFRDSNSQLFGDYSIYLLGIDDYLDDYLGKKVTIRENKKTEMKLRATNLFKRPPMILGGSSGDSRARTMQVF